MHTLGLILMSVGVLMYALIPPLADFNHTHATNPRWTRHARFHVVTQVFTTSSIGAVALWLLWSPSIERELGVCIAAILSFAVIGSFFASAGLRNFYGGALGDTESGMPKLRRVDLNAVNFGAAAILLVAGRLAVQ